MTFHFLMTKNVFRKKRCYFYSIEHKKKKIPYDWSEIFKTFGFLTALLIEQLLLLSLHLTIQENFENHLQYQQHIFIISILPWIFNVLQFLGQYCLKKELTQPSYLFLFTYPAPIVM